MFDRLIELLTTWFRHLVPFVVMEPFEQGVHTRLGKFVRILEPGFHWVLPLGIDVVFNEHITPRTERLTGLGTTTKDGRSIGFDAVVTYRINDLKRAILDVTDLKDAIADTCAGLIGTTLHAADWESIVSGVALENVEQLCRKRGWKWGVEIMAVQLTGVALVKNLRLTGIQSQSGHTLHIDTPA